MRLFGKEWFLLHQTKLLKFANTRLGRHVFGIEQGPGTVVKITPHGFSYLRSIDLKTKRGSVDAYFFTGPVLAQRLHKKLNPFWKFLHFTDWLILDRQSLVPDFGFDAYVEFFTLPGDGIAFDQPISYTPLPADHTWAELKAATSGVPGSTLSTLAYIGAKAGTHSSNFGGLFRAAFMFNTTSGLESGNSPNIMDLRVMPYNVSGPYMLWTGSEQGIVCTNPDLDWEHDKMYSADWDNMGIDTAISEDVLTSTIQAYSWVTLPFNAAGIAAYNNSGITQIGLACIGDQADIEPEYDDAYTYTRIYQVDYSSGQYAPILHVKYSLDIWISHGGLQKDVVGVKINIGDDWKEVANMYINIGDVWKSVN